MMRFNNTAAIIALALVAIPIALQLWGNVWIGEIATSFRTYYFLPLAICLCFYTVHRKWSLTLPTVVLIALNVMPIIPLLSKANGQPGISDLVVVQVNVENKNRTFASLLNWLGRVEPDVVGVEELTPDWDKVLRERLPKYDAYTLPRTDCFGIGIFSKLPLRKVEVFIPKGVRPAEAALIAHLKRGDSEITVPVVHTLAPHRPDEMSRRNEQLRQLAAEIRKCPNPKVLLGDLNTVPWSSVLTDFAHTVDMRDVRHGHGVLPTCLVKGLLWVPIDYCLSDPTIQVVDASVGPHIGSDHVPLLAKLRIP